MDGLKKLFWIVLFILVLPIAVIIEMTKKV